MRSTTLTKATPSSSSASFNSADISNELLLINDPKKLIKTYRSTLDEDTQSESKGKNTPFFAEKMKLFNDRKTRQFMAVTTCARLRTMINEHREAIQQNPFTYKSADMKDVNVATSKIRAIDNNLASDTKTWFRLGKMVCADFTRIGTIGSDCIVARVFVLWHALDEAEKQHQIRYEMNFTDLFAAFKKNAQTTIQKHSETTLNFLKKIYNLKKDLEEIADVGLYVYRLHQHVINENRVLYFAPGWNDEKDYHTKITGFSQACTAYRKAFERITLLHKLKKCSAFGTIKNLNDILRMENTPEFSAIMTKEVPAEILEQILSWLTQAIEGITTPLSHSIEKTRVQLSRINLDFNHENITHDVSLNDTNSLLSFIHLVKNEQVLKDTLWFAQSIFLSVTEKTKSFDSILTISPAEFSYSLTTSSPSHEEVIANDKKRNKELEKSHREKRAVVEEKKREHTFTEKLKKDNEEKQNMLKMEKKSGLIEKIKKLNNQQHKQIIAFLDPNNNAHQTFNENTICTILLELGLLEKTTKGYKVTNTYTITSTHRSHDGKLNADFVRDLRSIITDLGIIIADLEGTVPSQSKIHTTSRK